MSFIHHGRGQTLSSGWAVGDDLNTWNYKTKEEQNVFSLRRKLTTTWVSGWNPHFPCCSQSTELLFMWRMCLWKWNSLRCRCHKFRLVKVEVHYHCQPQSIQQWHWALDERALTWDCSLSVLVLTCFSLLFWLPLVSWQCQHRQASDIVTSSPV